MKTRDAHTLAAILLAVAIGIGLGLALVAFGTEPYIGAHR